MEILQYTSHSKEELLTTGIYKIEIKSKPNCYYIGSAACVNSKNPNRIGFLRRWLRHLTTLKHNKHYNIKLQRAVNKYGLNNLLFSIIEICEPDKCIEREIYYISHFNSCVTGYNFYINASNSLGTKHSEETKRKISLGNKGKILSEETKQKLRESRLGTKMKQEVINKIKATRIKREIYLYNCSGELCYYFQTSTECEDFFNLKRGRAVNSVRTFIKFNKKYVGSFVSLTQEEASHRYTIPTKTKYVQENTVLTSGITKGSEVV